MSLIEWTLFEAIEVKVNMSKCTGEGFSCTFETNPFSSIFVAGAMIVHFIGCVARFFMRELVSG